MASSMLQGSTPEDRGGSLTSSDLIIDSLEDLEGKDFERFKDKLSDFSYKDIRPIPRGALENANLVVTKNLLINFYGEAAALDVTVKVLRFISLMGPAEELQIRIEKHGVIKTKSLDNRIEDFRKRYMPLMKERYQSHIDGNACLGETVHLDKRYTKLLIIKKQRNRKEREHEIITLGQRHLEIMDERSSSQYSPITIDRLFDPDEDGIVPKIVVLQGPAGVGKTMTSRKIILDWANGTFYQDKFHFIFYMSCRELNTLSGDISLAGLVRKLCQISCEKDLLKSILGDPPKLLFLVDGFDELRWTSVSDTEVCEDPFQETSKEILLNSIFRQSCLPGASLIITTRPCSLEQLSKLFLSPRHVEILGFLGSDREQFFYSFFPAKEEAELALSIVKDNDTLFTMCVIPITCWIVCTVIKQQMSERQREIDCKTSTSIYLLYLKSLIKYHCRNSNQSVIKCVRKICALANEGVWSQKILFGDDDLRRHELSIKDIESVFLNENIFQRDVETQTCYSFIHLTVQEFFAALYYVVGNKNKITSMASAKNAPIKKLLEEGKYKSHLQLTIQFLYGLFSEKQQKEMGKFLGNNQFSFRENSVMVDWLIKNYHYRVSFKYLYETQDEDFIGRLMAHFPDIKVINPGHTFDYSALSYCLKNSRSEHQIIFINCKIGPKIRALLSSALHKCSDVRFSHCFILGNEGDEKLPYTNSSLSGLFNSQCGIRRLQLYECSLKSYCCKDLCPVIANKSLARLSLSRNYLQDSGIKLLCKGLTDKDCVLQELSLQDCGLTSNCCADLCSFITTNRTLTMLDLSKNTLDDVGLKVLCEGLRHPGCTVQDLRFEECHFLPSYCEDLSNIITANRSLKSINLSSNDLQDSGVKHLCQGLQHPECALQELRLMYCGLTSSCCDDLRSVLITNRTLNKLLLKGNTLGNAGIKLLCDGLKHPGCTLQELRLESCGLTSYRCEDIRSIITTNQSLIKLDLTLNHLSDSGIETLCEGLGHPGCILQELLITKEDLTRNLVSDLENEKPKKTFLPKWFWRSKPGNTQTVVSPKTPSQ